MKDEDAREVAEQQRETVMKWWRTEGGRKKGGIMDEDNRSALEQGVVCVCVCPVGGL